MSKLPDAPQLARECQGRSYLEIAQRYGVSDEAVRQYLKRHGLFRPRRLGGHHPIKISTALTLIGQGVTGYRELAHLLNYQSVSGVFYFIDELIRRGLVEKTEHSQLRLTPSGERFHEVPTFIVHRRADGAFEPLTPGDAQ